MRDYRDAKTMAKGLRRSLADLGTELTHSQSLELIAQAFGFDNWNILAAKIDASRPELAADKRPGDPTMHCSFCSKSQHDVKTLIAGPSTFICNECVAMCDDVLEDTELLRFLKDASGPDPGGLEHYLADRTPEQLATYLTRTEKHIRDGQETLESLDGDPTALPTWLQAQDGPGRARIRARLVTQLAQWRKSVEIVGRELAARS